METAEIGRFGVGPRKETGQQTVDFSLSTRMVVLNTTFGKMENRRVTYKVERDGPRWSIYYVKEKIKNRQKIVKC